MVSKILKICLPEFTLEVICFTSIFFDFITGKGREKEVLEFFLRSEALLILERGAKIPYIEKTQER